MNNYLFLIVLTYFFCKGIENILNEIEKNVN